MTTDPFPGTSGDAADWASLLSHDVVAPLTIAGHVLASVVERDLPEDVRARVEAVVDGTARARGHAERLARLLRLPPPGPVGPVELADVVARVVAARSGWPSPAVEVDGALDADPVLLGEVVDELLDHAVVGGATRITVTAGVADGNVVLTVRDDGPADAARRRHERGSLCLARTARIVGDEVDVANVDDGLRTSTTLPPPVASWRAS